MQYSDEVNKAFDRLVLVLRHDIISNLRQEKAAETNQPTQIDLNRKPMGKVASATSPEPTSTTSGRGLTAAFKGPRMKWCVLQGERVKVSGLGSKDEALTTIERIHDQAA